MSRVPTAVLISGRGSNMLSLLYAAAAPAFPARITAVFSNVPSAPGLEAARQAGIEAVAIDHRPFGRDRAAHEAALNAALQARGVQLICLAGYMRLLTPFLVGAWHGRMMNIHPSLLPAYPGLHTHARALSKWGSSRRRPITSPPGGGINALPNLASSGPASRKEARICSPS